MNGGFNLSEWAIQRRSLILFLAVLSAVGGILAYFNLGRDEDPEFTFKTMIVSAAWPGATIEQTTDQITDRLERTLEEVPHRLSPAGASPAVCVGAGASAPWVGSAPGTPGVPPVPPLS